YDPLFFIPEYHKTFGELGSRIKNIISHRSIAVRKLLPRLATLYFI
ncbi:non-canonical purine NTP pyrophosphatase, partial [Planktothrix sp.]